MAIESIAKTLGSGSGIDISALVSGLVDAQFAAKNDVLNTKSETLKAQISAVSDLKSGITGFDSALKTLIRTGTLQTQPTSGNTSIVKVSALSGATVSSLNSTIEVRQLAQAQSAYTTTIADKTAAIGTGTLTFTFGTSTVADGAMTAFAAGSGSTIDVNITSANSSLTGIAAAINAKNAGITASVVGDSGGSRLVLKSASGATQAFTMTATEDVGAEGLAALNVGVGATGTSIGTAAQNAIVAIDGVPVQRSSNSILDLVTGVRLDLQSASVGTKVALGTQAPTDALSQAVNDVVDTYNELFATLKKATDPISGTLKSDPAAKSLLASLSALTTKELITGAADDTPTTLGEIGVATNRDGTLRVDATRLASSLSSFGSNIEKMFKSGAGLSSALSLISTAASSTEYGLGASAQNYTAAQSNLADDLAKATAQADAMRERMTKQFAGMDAAVAAYKSTQDMLKNQIDAWNSSK